MTKLRIALIIIAVISLGYVALTVTVDEFIPMALILGLSFAQNVAFSIVSRSRNRDNIDYHLIAAVGSNGVWFICMKQLMKTNMDGVMAVPYVIGTVAGSLVGVKIAMVVERWLGAASDSHLKSKEQKG
jgi:hypothetical protein